MPKRALERGEFGEVKLSGYVGGGWVAESKVRADKLRPSRWRATVLYQDGTTKRPRTITATDTAKERAKSKLDLAKRQAVSQTTAPEQGKATMEEAVRQYLADLEAGKVRTSRSGKPVSPSTVRTYRQVISTYILRPESLVRRARLDHITPLDLMRETEAMAEAGMVSHIHHVKAIWTTVFARAVLAGAISVNPARLMERQVFESPKPKTHGNGSTRDKDRALSVAEAEELVRKVYADPEAVRKGIADLILLGAYQGLRISEAVSLRWEDVDLAAEQPTLSVVGTLQPVKGRPRGEGIIWHAAPKSEASVRTIPLMGPAVVDMLRRRREERDQAPKHHDPEVQAIRERHVFLSPKGRTPNVDNINKDVRAALDRAGFPWATFHTFRHTVSVRMKAAGIAPIVAGRFLGHTEAVSMAAYSDTKSVPMAVLGVADQLALPAPA